MYINIYILKIFFFCKQFKTIYFIRYFFHNIQTKTHVNVFCYMVGRERDTVICSYLIIFR